MTFGISNGYKFNVVNLNIFLVLLLLIEYWVPLYNG
jgi:hypothetical protein